MNPHQLELTCTAVDALETLSRPGESTSLLAEHDRAVSEFLEAYSSAAAEARAEMRATFDRRHSGPLQRFTIRMAQLGLRERARARLLLGLLAVAVDDGRDDYREVLLTITPVNDAALRIEVDVVALFDEAAESAAKEIAELLRGFPRRPPALQSLNMMGWRLEETADGPTYLFGWPKSE